MQAFHLPMYYVVDLGVQYCTACTVVMRELLSALQSFLWDTNVNKNAKTTTKHINYIIQLHEGVYKVYLNVDDVQY